MSEDDLMKGIRGVQGLQGKPLGKHTQAEADRESDKEDGHKKGGMLAPLLLFGGATLGAVMMLTLKRGKGAHNDIAI